MLTVKDEPENLQLKPQDVVLGKSDFLRGHYRDIA